MIYLKNEKGLSASLVLSPLVSGKGFKLLQDYAATSEASSDFKEFVALLDTLPKGNGYVTGVVGFDRDNDFDEEIKHQSFKGEMIGVLLPDLFKSNTSTGRDYRASAPGAAPTPEGLGWAQMERIESLLKKVDQDLVFLRVSVPKKLVSHIRGKLKKSGEWSIIHDTPESMLASDTCAIYFPESNGFANDKGSPVPISGARLFESSAAAQRTIQSRGWTNVVVVKARIELTGVDFEQKNQPKSFGKLGEALAHKEARELSENTNEIKHQAPAGRPRL